MGLLDSSGDFKPFTVSFEVLINGDGTGVAASNPKLACFILNDDGNRHYVKDVVVASGQAASWERVSFTVPADATAYVNNDNGKGVTFGCTLIAGSSDNTTDETWGTGTGGDHSTSSSANIGYANGNYLGITNVQLEVGSVSTDFAHEDIGTTLNKCFRYFEKQDYVVNTFAAIGFSNTTTSHQMVLQFTEKRATGPTIAVSTATQWEVNRQGTDQQLTALAGSSASKVGMTLIATVSSGLTAGEAAAIRSNNSGNFITISSEL